MRHFLAFREEFLIFFFTELFNTDTLPHSLSSHQTFSKLLFSLYSPAFLLIVHYLVNVDPLFPSSGTFLACSIQILILASLPCFLWELYKHTGWRFIGSHHFLRYQVFLMQILGLLDSWVVSLEIFDTQALNNNLNGWEGLLRFGGLIIDLGKQEVFLIVGLWGL